VASFPALDPSKGSFLDPRDGRVIDYDGDGKVLVRKLHDDAGTFKLKFEVDAADRATLMAHYAAHELAIFDFAWIEDGVTYQVKYVKAPVIHPGEVEHRDVDVELAIAA
jgi:hypothetical protein